MEKTPIITQNAPQAIGPYSQAIAVGKLLFTSGQIPINPENGLIESDDIEHQTHRVMQNLAAVLKECGLGFENVIKTTVFLTDLSDFTKVNEIYGTYFPTPYPARSCVQVAALPKGAKIEAELIASFERVSRL